MKRANDRLDDGDFVNPRKKKNTFKGSQSFSSNMNVDRRNSFTPLQIIMDHDEGVQKNNVSENVKKPESIRQIVILKTKSGVIRLLLQSIQIEDYVLKNISLGQKVMCLSLESYEKRKNMTSKHFKKNIIDHLR